jgi:hypothetical protein
LCPAQHGALADQFLWAEGRSRNHRPQLQASNAVASPARISIMIWTTVTQISGERETIHTRSITSR